MTRALSLFCPAKLNLYLRITGRRADGYHLLATLLHAIDLGDELGAERTDGGLELSIAAADPRDALPVQDDNLVLRAARAFAQAAGVRPGFRFWLQKRIPHGGGLGGGSSDAAAALRLCNALCARDGDRGPLDAAALHAIARTLGADVPFFLRGGSQWGFGVGDELEPCSVAPQHFTLLVPPFGCPTADVYKNFAAHWNGTFDAASIRCVRDSHHNDFASRDGFVNDLAAAAERVRPELQQLRRQAADLGVGVAMTGSGSVLFAAAPSRALAEGQRQRLAPLQQLGVRLLAARSAVGAFAPVATGSGSGSSGSSDAAGGGRSPGGGA